MARRLQADAGGRIGASQGWVPDTRFGVWFQGTSVWRNHVLLPALAELERLLAQPAARFASVLDVGCGQGVALRELERRFRPEVLLGIDIDPEMIGKAHSAASACEGKVDLRVGDVAGLELPDSSIDLAFCHQTLHHLDRQTDALRELRRVLRPGGTLLLAESCRSFIMLPWVRLFFRHPMGGQRTADEFVALLRGEGFEATADRISTPDPWWSRRDLGLRERLLRSHSVTKAHTLVCVAAKRPTL